jgi:Doubled CXXCH motif (Paired_CXXCH_1)
VKRLAEAILCLVLTLGVPALGADQNAQCLACHGDEGAAFKTSIHGSLACTGCHNTIRGFPHPENPGKVNCGACHSDAQAALAGSVHAAVAPQPCLSCHGDPHAILPPSDAKSTVYPLNLPRTCGSCHGNAKLAQQYGLPEVYSLYIDSIHGFALTKEGLLVAASCSSCHGSHHILPHTNPQSRTYRSNIPATCGNCHAGPKNAFLAGIHGKLLEAGSPGAPVCTNCHTAHQITNVQTASFQMRVTSTCGGCHVEQATTYRDTFHGQVSELGYREVAHCWDCHGFHDILPPSNPQSTVAKANLITTCGKCHAGANASFVAYQPHADPSDKAAYPALHYAAVFMNFLLVSVLGFFLLHSILWFIRSKFGPRENAPGGSNQT